MESQEKNIPGEGIEHPKRQNDGCRKGRIFNQMSRYHEGIWKNIILLLPVYLDSTAILITVFKKIAVRHPHFVSTTPYPVCQINLQDLFSVYIV